MSNKRFYFDFYQCVTIDTANQNANTNDVFNILLAKFESNPEETVKRIGTKIFEIRQIERTDYGFKGILGKHRISDLPHAAFAGGREREIPLEENENLLEKSYFNFYTENSLLIIQRNRFCFNWLNLGKFLSSTTQTTAINPIIEPANLEWLMRDDVRIRTLEINIARPRNAELFQECRHDFNNSIFATLNGTESAKVNLVLRGDAKAADPEEKYLGSRIKHAFEETLETFEVSKLKLETEDIHTGVDHPLDLIADRLSYFDDVEMIGRYPVSVDMWEKLLLAKASKAAELNAYFGENGNQVH